MYTAIGKVRVLLPAGVLVGVAVVFGVPDFGHADVRGEIAQRTEQIRQLEQQIAAYQAQADAAGQQSRSLESEIAKLNANIGQIETQIRALELSMERTDLEITETEAAIMESEREKAIHHDALGEYIREYAQFDEDDLTTILLQSEDLSDFFDHLNDLERSQQQLQATIQSIRQLQEELGVKQEALRDKQEELEHLRGLEEVEQRSLAYDKSQKNAILQESKGQEERFQNLVQQGQRDIERIRQQIYYLQQSGITAEDAVKFAELAAIGAGIRPAFLLALLEVESRLGQNVGTGNWQDDMVLCYRRLGDIWYPNRRDYYYKRAATEEAAFLKITSRLGLDPNTVKVSKEPNYGCGGAMGPAQFIPSTWLAYEEDVRRITGHPVPNPWNFEDAFTASAVKLARGGASSKDRYGEDRAARAYVSGNPTCTSSICNSYSNTVLQKAAAIAQNL